MAKAIDPLTKQTEFKKEQASKNIEIKIKRFKELVIERINAKHPMGDLPTSLSAFVTWELEGCHNLNRGTIYQDHNKKFRTEIDNLCETVKNPPIPSSVEERYKKDISDLSKQLSGLGEINLHLREKLKDVTEQMHLIAEDKDDEIKRLKDLLLKTRKLRPV